MVVDFHTHIFPEQIAGKTIKKLEEVGGIKAYTDGTLSGLKKSMKEAGITTSVILPVVTKPSQFETVNAYAHDITGKDGILSFGGIHPESLDYKSELETIKNLGLLGIKLHPDYQNTYVDDPKMVQIIRYASTLGLIVILHAGIDIGLPNPVHCPPDRALAMLDQINTEHAKIVFAHTGGYGLWDDVEKYLVGKPIWLDISFSLGNISDEQFIRIVKNHGTDKILFATDSPWSSQSESVQYLKNLDFTKEELDQIFYKNAHTLLGLPD